MAYNNTYPSSSPYVNTDVVKNTYLDVMNYVPVPKNPTDVLYTITTTYQYRPDLLAYDLYNDPTLWWVFASRNPNALGPDPYFNFVEGLQIYIPTINTLKAILRI